MRALIVLGFTLAAGVANANAFVNGPKGCEYIDEWSGDYPVFTVDEEHTILVPEELRAIEWFCAFETPFDPYMETGEIQVRAGYCMEPGEVFPGVFTLMEMGDGTVQLKGHDWPEPLVLEVCPAPF